ncbi:hypothetical protein EV121DRAFT_196139 [Schizophyllum commune]
MDNGPTKATLGGIGVTLKEAAGFLQRKIEDPNNTQTTASNAHAAAEDLRYNAQMFLMAYIELQAIIKKILTMRKDGTPFTSEEKQRIAQFFYSFSRHFDTASKLSIEHTAREGYRKFARSRSGRQASRSTTASSEELAAPQGLPIYNHGDQVRTSEQFARRR